MSRIRYVSGSDCIGAIAMSEPGAGSDLQGGMHHPVLPGLSLDVAIVCHYFLFMLQSCQNHSACLPSEVCVCVYVSLFKSYLVVSGYSSHERGEGRLGLHPERLQDVHYEWVSLRRRYCGKTRVSSIQIRCSVCWCRPSTA